MKCPFCSEDILDNAQVCKHCGRDFLMVRPLLDQPVEVVPVVRQFGTPAQRVEHLVGKLLQLER